MDMEIYPHVALQYHKSRCDILRQSVNEFPYSSKQKGIMYLMNPI